MAAEIVTVTLKALSLYQPWATLIALGLKKYETRGWGTDHRGALLIHAAKRADHAMIARFADLIASRGVDPWRLPCGAAVAVCNLTACITVNGRNRDSFPKLEHDLGDLSLGRVAWRLEQVRRIEPAIPLRGKQGIFTATIDWPRFDPAVLEGRHDAAQG